jgi:hypothetical protein
MFSIQSNQVVDGGRNTHTNVRSYKIYPW